MDLEQSFRRTVGRALHFSASKSVLRLNMIGTTAEHFSSNALSPLTGTNFIGFLVIF